MTKLSLWLLLAVAGAKAVTIPDPLTDAALAPKEGERTAVFAGGCFWGVEAVFEHVKGVKDVWSGYAGGSASTANYGAVVTGRTGHAESIQITYDPSRISYGQLLKVFFSVAHNPTELNRQGPDEGTQYRSAIFVSDMEQRTIAQSYIEQLNQAKVYRHKIVTQVVDLKAFYKAEAYHQDFVKKNPNHPYVAFHDLPKLRDLRQEFPNLFTVEFKGK
jgi:peptide-methionine (S)-S-oxide reductase